MVHKLKQLRHDLDSGTKTLSEIIGLRVQIGFLQLTVTGYEETPGDSMPNDWMLSRNGKKYVFTPHHGLHSID